MPPRLLVALAAIFYASSAYSQSAPSGSATLSGPQPSVVCRETVAGFISMADIIAQAGSAEALYAMSQGQLAEYDSWFTEMRAARAQGVAVAQIDTLIAEGEENYKIELEISEAALCYMNQ